MKIKIPLVPIEIQINEQEQYVPGLYGVTPEARKTLETEKPKKKTKKH